MGIVEEWHADIQITEELVRSCLQEQFPALMPIKEVKCLGEGWDNKSYLINNEIIFRFPRRKASVELLEQENRILNSLPAFFPIEIPHLKYIGYPTSRYPYPYHGYPLIKGVSAYQAQLSEQERLASLPILANFLKKLHSLNEKQALTLGAKLQVFNKDTVNKTIDILREQVTKIRDKWFHVNNDCFAQELEIVQKLAIPYEDKCFVHADLDCRHLIFNEKKLVGIIDWGDMGIDNRAIDLAIIWIFYPNNCHEQFFEIYGKVDPATWQYARFIGLYSAFTLLIYGLDISDALLVKDAIATIKKLNPNM